MAVHSVHSAIWRLCGSRTTGKSVSSFYGFHSVLLRLPSEAASSRRRKPRGRESAAAPELHPKQERRLCSAPRSQHIARGTANRSLHCFRPQCPQTIRGTVPIKLMMNVHIHMPATPDKMARGETAATHCQTRCQKEHCPRPL
jgi:hypothetical protein